MSLLIQKTAKTAKITIDGEHVQTLSNICELARLYIEYNKCNDFIGRHVGAFDQREPAKSKI